MKGKITVTFVLVNIAVRVCGIWTQGDLGHRKFAEVVNWYHLECRKSSYLIVSYLVFMLVVSVSVK